MFWIVPIFLSYSSFNSVCPKAPNIMREPWIVGYCYLWHYFFLLRTSLKIENIKVSLMISWFLRYFFGVTFRRNEMKFIMPHGALIMIQGSFLEGFNVYVLMIDLHVSTTLRYIIWTLLFNINFTITRIDADEFWKLFASTHNIESYWCYGIHQIGTACNHLMLLIIYVLTLVECMLFVLLGEQKWIQFLESPNNANGIFDVAKYFYTIVV